MRIAHFAAVSPNRCGLYGTVKDLMKAEQQVGIDAGIIDVGVSNGDIVADGRIEGYPKISDPLLQPKDCAWAEKADVMFRHTLIPTYLQNIGKPLVLPLHGRPESSFRLEAEQNNLIMTTLSRRIIDQRYKAFLTFWPEHVDYWATMCPREKLFYVPAPVDLEIYTPDGDKWELGEHDGRPNILIADMWREDVNPFHVIHAAFRFQQKYEPNAKIHIAALQGKHLNALSPMLAGMKKAGALGLIFGLHPDIIKIYRACDLLVTPQTIATRTVREPLACGVPIVAGHGSKYTPWTADPRNPDEFAEKINECWQAIKASNGELRGMVRKSAEMLFNPLTTGMAVKTAMEAIL